MVQVPKDAVIELGQAAALPRINASTAKVLNRLYSRSSHFDFELNGTKFRLNWRALRPSVPSLEVFGFRLGSHSGQLAIDERTVGVLIGERRSAALPVELRYLLMAQALHPVADRLEKALRLHFEWSLPEPTNAAPLDEAHRDDAAFFLIDIGQHRGACAGFLRFDDSGVLDSLVATLDPQSRRPGKSMDWLRLPMRFLLGSTQLSLREMGGIKAGDIVGIEEWGSADKGLLVTARLGGRELVGFAEGTKIIIQQSKDIAMNRDTSAPAATPSAEDADGLPLDRLDALEVALRFEVGDLSVSLGELRNVRTGHVFDLSQPLNRSPVRIVAHGNVLGKGYLVAVGDRLGVRVAEFAPGEP